MAAAEGIRQTVRAKHGRWKREATVTEYDGLAPGEDTEVTRVLQRRLARAWAKGDVRSRESGRKRQRQREAAGVKRKGSKRRASER